MMAFIVFVDIIVAIHGQPALVASKLIVVVTKVIESSRIERNRYTWVRNNWSGQRQKGTSAILKIRGTRGGHLTEFWDMMELLWFR